ncbi:MAG TPA: addiction module protein [Candidatus Kapabacteria bacterium]|nr:addiction module protein [Candidatus Kapabacteria bacterium]
MDRDVNRVIEEALELPPEDRLRVAERIYESMPEDEITTAWLDEAERRQAEWDAGLVEGVNIEDVLKKARARISK